MPPYVADEADQVNGVVFVGILGLSAVTSVGLVTFVLSTPLSQPILLLAVGFMAMVASEVMQGPGDRVLARRMVLVAFSGVGALAVLCLAFPALTYVSDGHGHTVTGPGANMLMFIAYTMVTVIIGVAVTIVYESLPVVARYARTRVMDTAGMHGRKG